MLKKILFLSIILLFAFKTANAISAKSAVLIDAENGRILFEHNAYEKRGMASTTKIMTAITVLENCNINELVTVSFNAASTEGSSMYLEPKEKISVENLLYGLMLSSGNDAATALAEHVSGNTETFAKLMNKKANELGMKNSSFANPHGLDDENHYSTAYDMAILTKYAMSNEIFRKIVQTDKKTLEISPGKFRYLTNHNKLLSMYEWCRGVKTGFTKKCGRCLVSYSEKNGVKLIAITLNAQDDWNDHINLFNNYFNTYKSYNIIKSKEYICSVNLKKASDSELKLYCCKAINLTLNQQEYEKITLEYNYPESINSPVYLGQTFGTVNVKLNNKIIASSPIVSLYGISEKQSSTYKDNLLFLFNNLISLFFKSI